MALSVFTEGFDLLDSSLSLLGGASRKEEEVKVIHEVVGYTWKYGEFQ